jgi:hypothetical protein
VDSIGIIGLVAGLWFALSPVDGQRPSATVWLGWVLAGACTVLLLAGTLTEPLDPGTDATVTTKWTTEQAPDSMPQGGSGGRGPFGAFGATQPGCSLTCG